MTTPNTIERNTMSKTLAARALAHLIEYRASSAAISLQDRFDLSDTINELDELVYPDPDAEQEQLDFEAGLLHPENPDEVPEPEAWRDRVFG